VSYPDRNKLREVLRDRAQRDVDVIVVTDGQRILGLGDQGIGGMGIPIGKLSLYTLIGGINPARTLPIVLDVGTDNVELLDDPQYLGWRHRRITDDDYDAFIDEFVATVQQELPDVLLQWEDFANAHALPILQRYRDKLLTFNDDIQGTAAVTLGALHGAAKVAGRPLSQQQIVMFGAASAGIGVLNMIRREMVAQGLSEQDASARIWVVNSHGLLTDDRTDLSAAQRNFAQPANRVADWGLTGRAQLADVVHHVDVGVLLGLSTAAGAFTEDIVRELAGKTERPIIFPLSNPTSRAEAHPAELDEWTLGRALIAAGSPFAPLRRDGVERPIAQCNNAYIFPAMGLAVTAAQATRVTDEMMRVAAATLGDASPALADPNQPLLPAWSDVPDVAVRIAHAVAVQAVADGDAPKRSADELTKRIAQVRWTPEYSQGASNEIARQQIRRVSDQLRKVPSIRRPDSGLAGLHRQGCTPTSRVGCERIVRSTGENSPDKYAAGNAVMRSVATVVPNGLPVAARRFPRALLAQSRRDPGFQNDSR
jgi:malate dehydrogenase (oxaloacetate-decarboxylating)